MKINVDSVNNYIEQKSKSSYQIFKELNGLPIVLEMAKQSTVTFAAIMEKLIRKKLKLEKNQPGIDADFVYNDYLYSIEIKSSRLPPYRFKNVRLKRLKWDILLLSILTPKDIKCWALSRNTIKKIKNMNIIKLQKEGNEEGLHFDLPQVRDWLTPIELRYDLNKFTKHIVGKRQNTFKRVFKE